MHPVRMRAAVLNGPGDVRIEQVPDPSIRDAGDSVVRVVAAAICGSDLWSYRGISKAPPGTRMGHEFLGVVEDVGEEVSKVRPRDMVVAPFYYLDGRCQFCLVGLSTSCVNGSGWGGEDDGGQGEAVRVPFTDATLVPIPDVGDALASILPVSDVLATGHHAVVSAGVGPGSDVVIIGDGAVGLCAALEARRLNAERVIVVGHHSQRLDLALRLGADEVVKQRAIGTIEIVRDATRGGAAHVCECVGTQSSMDLALDVVRDGGRIGFVGVPGEGSSIPVARLYGRNVAIAGGVAPVRSYMEELLREVIDAHIDPAPIFDLDVDLDGVPHGYAAMDKRHALKVLIRP